MKRLSSLLFIILIAGCAGSPMAITMMPKKELCKVPDNQLCAAYAWSRTKTIKNEIIDRHLFTENEWRAVKKKDVYIGMSKNAMLAARPNLCLTGISKIGEYGMVEIYKEMMTIADAYIYVRDEKVAGYQMW